MTEIEIPVTDAQTFIEVIVQCHLCDKQQDIFEDVHDSFDINEGPRADGIDKEIKCNCCEEIFMVIDVTF